jgi:hypothetical protein
MAVEDNKPGVPPFFRRVAFQVTCTAWSIARDLRPGAAHTPKVVVASTNPPGLHTGLALALSHKPAACFAGERQGRRDAFLATPLQAVQAGQAVPHASFGDSRIVEAADRLTLTVLPSDPTAAPAAQARPNPVVCGRLNVWLAAGAARPARLEPFGEGGVAAAGARGSDRLGQGALTADQIFDSSGPGPGRPQRGQVSTYWLRLRDSARRRRPRNARALTVPSGTPRCVAISDWVKQPKYASTRTSRCASGRRSSASRTSWQRA